MNDSPNCPEGRVQLIKTELNKKIKQSTLGAVSIINANAAWAARMPGGSA